MGHAGVRHAVFVSSARHLFTDMDPVIWLTGFKPMLPAAAVVSDDGDAVLYVTGEWEAQRAAGAAAVVATDDPFGRAGADVGARAARGARLGTAGARKLNTVEYRAIAGEAAVEPVRIDAALDEQARSKD